MEMGAINSNENSHKVVLMLVAVWWGRSWVMSSLIYYEFWEIFKYFKSSDLNGWEFVIWIEFYDVNLIFV